jgi:hypothetical protein
LHWKVEPGLSDEKAKAAEVLVVVPDGPESIVVCGGVVATVNAGSSTEWVASRCRRRRHWPSFDGPNAGQDAPASKLALRFHGEPLAPGWYWR